MRGWAVGSMALLATAFAACDSDVADGGPSNLPPAIYFATADQTTGTSAVSIWVTDNGRDVPLDLVSGIATQVCVTSWPGGVEAPSTSMVSTVPGERLASGGLRLAHGVIDLRLDPAVDGSGWYAVSLAERPGELLFQNEDVLFPFDGGSLGVRVSPAHPPLVASVMACAKDGGVVAVYAQFSELVSKVPGALALDYGNNAATCPAGAEAADQDQFLCANATAGQPFSLHILGAVTAHSSGLPMATGTLSSADMQVSVRTDGCRLYKPAIAAASSASR